MSLTINTNLSSLIVQKSLLNSTLGLNQAIERMTTGFKINHAKDNAAGYSIATNMGVKLSSYNVAMDNAAMGLDLITTASDSFDLISSHLQRMRDLAEQAANGTYGENSLKAIQSELAARESEISRIIANTEYNGMELFENSIDESKRVVNQTSFQAGETYYITSSEDLVKLQDMVNGGVDTTNVTFELMSNIDMSGVSFRGIGKDYTNSFKGTFNGNNYIISNLSINVAESYVGLFGHITSGSVIDSVGLENVDITGGAQVGGVVGYSQGSVSNCYSSGNVEGYGTTGGLVGLLKGYISNSYSIGNVNGDSSVGGLVGHLNSSSNVSRSYSKANVTGRWGVGGFAGGANGTTINFCYSVGKVVGTKSTGAFIGCIDSGSPSLNEVYYNSQTSGQSSSVGSGSYYGVIIGITSTQLSNLIANGTLPQYDYEDTYGKGPGITSGREFTMQVGIDSSDPVIILK